MISEKYHHMIKRNVKKLHRFVGRIWFPPMLILLSMLDVLVIVIPADGILVSSSMLKKKRWPFFALSVAIGSTLGALLLFFLVDYYGLGKILEFYPGINQSHAWNWTLKFFNQYGLLVVFLVGLTPFSQQPVLLMAALSELAFVPLVTAIFFSRIIKFSVMAYIATRAPRMLKKIWGVKNELKDAGVKIN
ncbi:MAG: VTT domain-containing protein [Bacteriovorax sp.]|jgi:membrane protein YqaA with SNARE-associated domain